MIKKSSTVSSQLFLISVYSMNSVTPCIIIYILQRYDAELADLIRRNDIHNRLIKNIEIYCNTITDELINVIYRLRVRCRKCT